MAYACQMRWTGELSIIITLDWEKRIRVVKLCMTFESGPECTLTVFWAIYDSELIQCMRLLSIRIMELMRSLGTYASVFYAYAQHKRKNNKFEKGLQHILIMRIRNWCVHWACTSEIKWCLVPPKCKVTSLYFSPKVTNPERLHVVCRSWKSEQSKISHLGTFKGTQEWDFFGSSFEICTFS